MQGVRKLTTIQKLNCAKCLKGFHDKCLNPETCLCFEDNHGEPKISFTFNEQQTNNEPKENTNKTNKKKVSIRNRLEQVIEICSKEVIDETENIFQITLGMLSAWTDNPQNIRVLAPSGEGKTYLVNHVAKFFPQENIIKLSNATPQSLKYNTSKKVIENGPGLFQDYDIAMDPLVEELEATTDKDDKKEIKSQIREMQNNVYDYVDFNNKILIFLDAQSMALWQSIKTNLSHDDKIIKTFSANKNKSGIMKAQKIIFDGWPAVIYCSAKDEVSQDKTDEINTRFNTISIKGKPEKYRKMLKLQSMRMSVPPSIYGEKVVSDEEIRIAENLVLGMINNIKNFEKVQSVFNPYGDWIAEQFKGDAGYRNRQLAVFLTNVNILTLANADLRPKAFDEENEYPFAIKSDILIANELTKEGPPIAINKIQFFNENIKPAIVSIGEPRTLIDGDKVFAASARQIADEVKVINSKITTDRKKILENFLVPLSDHGYLDQYQDPNNKKQNIFSISPRYQDKDAEIESTFIDKSTINDSCLDLFIEKYIDCRLRFKDKDEKIISKKSLLSFLISIDSHRSFLGTKKALTDCR